MTRRAKCRIPCAVHHPWMYGIWDWPCSLLCNDNRDQVIPQSLFASTEGQHYRRQNVTTLHDSRHVKGVYTCFRPFTLTSCTVSTWTQPMCNIYIFQLLNFSQEGWNYPRYLIEYNDDYGCIDLYVGRKNQVRSEGWGEGVKIGWAAGGDRQEDESWRAGRWGVRGEVCKVGEGQGVEGGRMTTPFYPHLYIHVLVDGIDL